MCVTHQLLEALLKNAPNEQRFLSVPDIGNYSYGEVVARSQQLAAGLAAAGATVGDRVLVQVDKSPDAVALYLGCLRAGFVYVPINPAYTPAEVSYFAKDTEASVLVCRPQDEASHVVAAPKARVITLGSHEDGSLAELAANVEPHMETVSTKPEDLACMLYTSGTTGRSKGAMLSGSALLANGQDLHQVWAWEPGDVLVHSLPLFHVHGLFVALHCAMLNGSEVILLPRFDVAQVRRALRTATVMMGVPTHYSRLLADPAFGAKDCGSIRLFTSGSAPMTEGVHQEFTERTGHRIVERYGMTECGIITSNPYEGNRVPGTVGLALPQVQLRVVDGIVHTKGPHLFSGYWRMPDQTAEAITEDGWLITGDAGELDHNSRLTLAGRASDMIISGGFNVYPKEIELVLDATEAVTESAVIGVPHPDFGEAVVAVIVFNEGADHEAVTEAIQNRCQAELARFKHPKKVIAATELPRNAMGKVQKVELRSQHANLFQSAS